MSGLLLLLVCIKLLTSFDVGDIQVLELGRIAWMGLQ